MNKMIGYCGLICTDCPTFIATKNNDNEARVKTVELYKKLYGLEYEPEEINCDGCLSVGGRKMSYCKNCRIRHCCSDKGLENCVKCTEHENCEKIKSFHEFSSKAKAGFEILKNDN